MKTYLQTNAAGVLTGVTVSAEEQVGLVEAPGGLDFMTLQSFVGRAKWNGISLVPYVPPPRIITRDAFRRRFTEDELLGIYEAAESSPSAKVRAGLKKAIDDTKVPEEIDLDDPRVAAGLAKLVGAGFITAERAAEIAA